MFIDERNQIQFESIEELVANKEYAIKEITNWEIPTVEEIAEEMISNFTELAKETAISVDELIEGIEIGMGGLDYVQEVTDSILQSEAASLKIKEYCNNSKLACALVISELRKN